jgi:glycosyltransferase involved in cell wall biosynthesis
MVNLARRPVVSVIIPRYRHAQLLPEAVESVLAQTYSAVKRFIVSDWSPDNTEGVVEEYRFRVRHDSEDNRGLPAARSAGVSASTGRPQPGNCEGSIWISGDQTHCRMRMNR